MSIPLKLLGQAALVSLGRVGTGSNEQIRHDLGGTPGLILVQVRDSAAAAWVIGAKDGEFVNVQVTNTQVYDLLVWIDE